MLNLESDRRDLCSNHFFKSYQCLIFWTLRIAKIAIFSHIFMINPIILKISKIPSV